MAPGPSEFGDSVDALFDTLLPAEYDARGRLLSAGAREAGVDQIIESQHLARLLVLQGLVAPLPEAVLVALDDLTGSARSTLNALLDARAQVERPLARFHQLPLERRNAIVDSAFADDAVRPIMLVMRAACQLAYLGAVTSDVGLRQVGLPAFERFADGLAVSGYPRTKTGRLIDARTEDLGALQRAGELDDYTLNLQPQPTPTDDLSQVLTPDGNLR